MRFPDLPDADHAAAGRAGWTRWSASCRRRSRPSCLPLARVRAVAAPRRARRRPRRAGAARRAAVARRACRRCSQSFFPAPDVALRATRGSSAPTTTRTAPRARRRSTPARPHRPARRATGHINPDAGYGPWPVGRGVGARRRHAVSAKRDELADRARVAVRQPRVRAVEQLERVRDAQLVELGGERLRAEVEEVLVAACRHRGRSGASSAARPRERGAIRTGSLSSHCAQTSSIEAAGVDVERDQRPPGLAGSGE